ncbi:unnamed protein product [Sphagnum jensenii]|uniref:NERD domain-containing protein n=2 Tax=Sphagnum jensenii TaxID=128206 RepID=A0ABP0V9X7_9BRYO
MARGDRARRRSHHLRRCRSCSASAMAFRVLVTGALTAGAVALYRQFQSIISALMQPDQYILDTERESDHAGRIAELKISSLFEGIQGLKIFQSLRIPDPGERQRRDIDMILLTNRNLHVVEVINWSGTIELSPDGSWAQHYRNGATIHHPNILEEIKGRAVLLESYIERRGVILPPGFVQPKVLLVNRDCRPEQAITIRPEVLSVDKWEHFLDHDLGRMESKRMKSTLKGPEPEGMLSELEMKQLQYILRTAPMWDRLELEGGRVVIGEFKGFRGHRKDVSRLEFANRSTVSHLAISHQQSWILTQKVQVVAKARDYRDANANWPVKKQYEEPLGQASVDSDTDVVFQTAGTSKVQHFGLLDVLTLSLSS